MRSIFFLTALASAALGCGGPTPTPAPLDGPAADLPSSVDTQSERSPDDVATADVRDASTDAPNDLADASADVPDTQVPCVLDVPSPDVAGPTYGYLRFANLARGTGTLRFVARSLPMFAPAYVEAVVPEGTATEHILTLPVAYEVHVISAPDASASVSADVAFTDGGMLTDGPSSPTTNCDASAADGEVVPPTCTDVYFIAGCTIVLAGSRDGNVDQQRDRRLWRISDVPARSNDCYTGRVRTLNWFAEGPALDVDGAGGVPLARNAAYHETTGSRGVPIGSLRVSVRNNDTGDPLGDFVAGNIVAGHSHTLHVWGDAHNAANHGVSAIVLDDVTPAFR